MAKQLFTTNAGKQIADKDFVSALRSVDADKAAILFIHFGMTFGTPIMELKRDEILSAIYRAIREMNVKTIIFPTFTFSFPNGKDYDVKKSKSKMGALNEYVRRQPETVRSLDPLLSVALVGDKKYLATGVGRESIGRDCTFDMLHREENVKFLFLGTKPQDCFTYTHYIEWAAKVPYRYDRDFTGTIHADGGSYTATYKLFVRYKDVIPGGNDLANILLSHGDAKMCALGDSEVWAVDEPPAYTLLCEKIKQYPEYMLSAKLPSSWNDEFILNGEMNSL